MSSHKGRSLAGAYAVSRKAKKMAEGGQVMRTEAPQTGACIKGPDKGYGAIIRCNAEGGEVRPDPKTVQEALQNQSTWHARNKNRSSAYEELVAKPQRDDALRPPHGPNTPAYAEGGEIMEPKKRPKMQPLAQPSLRGSEVFKVRYSDGLEPAPIKRDKEQQRLHDEEAHLMDSMPPASPEEQPAKVMDEERPKRQGPKVPALDMKMMAEGGEIEEEDRAESIVQAIMAKRAMKRDAEGDIMHPGDEDLEEGQVDIDDNAYEMPNSYYHQNEEAALKENYDEDMMDVDQPMDSNEHDVEIESDKHDMISQIRSKMKRKMVK